MKQTSDSYSVRFYPFADDETTDSFLASMGYVNIVTDKSLALEQELDDKVIFNIQLRALTRSEWEQFKAAIELAFETQAALNSCKL